MIFESKEIIKLMKEYNVFQFDDGRDKYEISDGSVYPEDQEQLEYYSTKVYYDWVALNFVIFMNIIKFDLFTKVNKIPLIKAFREMLRPFNFGLKTTKEFVENLVEVNVLLDNQPDEIVTNFDHQRRYEITKSGENLINKMNEALEAVDINRIFAKCLLEQCSEPSTRRHRSMKNETIINYFDFYEIYDEDLDKLILKDLK